jgi:hypothetical protein
MNRSRARPANEKETEPATPDYSCSAGYSAFDHYLEDPSVLSPWHMVDDFGKKNRPNDFSSALWFPG